MSQGYILTTFAHGNGPFSRTVEWAKAVNDARESNLGNNLQRQVTNTRLGRLPIVVPLVYGERQKNIMIEELNSSSPGYLAKYPDEILFDQVHGELLSKLMFKGSNYAENLELLARDYYGVEADLHRHMNGVRLLHTMFGEPVAVDLRDVEYELGSNTRLHTGVSKWNRFYSSAGAGPFDELLERAIADPEIPLDKEAMRKALPIAQRMIQGYEVIMSNEPGVFSYDATRVKRPNEMFTPPFIHTPKPDDTPLPGKGIYLMATGIDGVRESGMYSAAFDLGMQLFAATFTIKGLPEGVRERVIPLLPAKINNPNIVAQYARAGWSSPWLSHLARKGFLTPAHRPTDDPEMLFNHRGIKALGLGAVLTDDPKASLEEAIDLARNAGAFNAALIERYGTLDGIKYAAEAVVRIRELSYFDHMGEMLDVGMMLSESRFSQTQEKEYFSRKPVAPEFLAK